MAVSDDAGGTENTQSLEENIKTSNNNLPGRRSKNPLGYYSSYNYQISLYLVTPDGMDLFRATGKRDINILNNNKNAYLAIQSGGINNNTNVTAPGFNLNYYIDDLVIVNATGKSTKSSTNVTSIKFKVIEPYGFSFISNLKKARDSFSEFTSQTRYPNNPTRLPFVLGVGFIGYDETGNVMSSNNQYDDLTLDPNASENSSKLFTKYYTLTITSIKFKIDGKSTTYDITAADLNQNVGFGIKNGFINTPISISAATVGDALDQMITSLNKQQADLFLADQITYPNVYTLEYRGLGDDVENNPIYKASMVEQRDLDKYRWAGSTAETTAQVNESVAGTPVSTKKDFVLDKIPVMQGVTQIIKQSSYMTDALRTVSTSAQEPDPVKKARLQAGNPVENFSWYTLSARVSKGQWDEKIKDYAYTITYIIEKYDAPVIENPLTNPGVGYYGPHKRYEYWYTGENSEVLEYEQRVDNNFFRIILDTESIPPEATTNGSGINPETPIQVGQQSPGDTTGGPVGTTLTVQNSVVNELYDDKSFAKAKITILGDPDFLMEDTIDSPSEVYNQFYGTNNFTINANGGQVFIELDFKEAVDYNYTSGTLSINNQVKFWNYPDEANIEGLSYQVITVTSTFSNGVFKQVLDCAMTYTFTDSVLGSNNNGEGPTANNNATTTNTGFIQNLISNVVPQFNSPSVATNTPIPYRLTEDD